MSARAIVTKYHGPTERGGARISATCDGYRTTIGYPHELNSDQAHKAAAEALCSKREWVGELTGGQSRSGYVFTLKFVSPGPGITTDSAAYNYYYLSSTPDTNGWKTRHQAAMFSPRANESIASILRGWVDMAVNHRAVYECGIGEDYYARDEWVAIGNALHRLLSMDIGRLDGGTCSAIIIETLTAEGYNFDMQEWRS